MRRNWLEWVVLIVSLMLIVSIAIVLGIGGLIGTQAGPELRIELEATPEQRGESWVVPAVIRNEGDAAAQNVVVEATAEVEGESQVSQLTIDFAPPGSRAEVVFAFSAEPRGAVTARVVGYELP